MLCRASLQSLLVLIRHLIEIDLHGRHLLGPLLDDLGKGGLRREATLTLQKLELSLNTHGPLLRTMKFLLSVCL